MDRGGGGETRGTLQRDKDAGNPAERIQEQWKELVHNRAKSDKVKG